MNLPTILKVTARAQFNFYTWRLGGSNWPDTIERAVDYETKRYYEENPVFPPELVYGYNNFGDVVHTCICPHCYPTINERQRVEVREESVEIIEDLYRAKRRGKLDNYPLCGHWPWEELDEGKHY